MTAPTQALGATGTTVLGGWRLDAPEPGGLAGASLVVPTFNRSHEVVRLVSHLAGLHDAPCEVVVVDGSPDDRTDEALLEAFGGSRLPFQLAYVRSPAGLTRQRNVGVDVSAGSVVFFLDDDCLPEQGYFATLAAVLADPRHPEVGAVCGSIVNEMNGSLSMRWRLRLALRLVPDGEPGRYFDTATSVSKGAVRPFRGTRPIDMVPGGASAYRREVLAQHRFSQFFDGYAQGEDLEMSCRIRRAGWRLLWCGDARVVHEHAPGGRPPRFSHGRMAVRNRFFIWKRYSPGAPVRVRVRFWSDVLFGLLYDFAATAVRPSKRQRLAYVAGSVWGIFECLVSPPSHDEPTARREYTFQPRPAPCHVSPSAPSRRRICERWP